MLDHERIEAGDGSQQSCKEQRVQQASPARQHPIVDKALEEAFLLLGRRLASPKADVVVGGLDHAVSWPAAGVGSLAIRFGRDVWGQPEQVLPDGQPGGVATESARCDTKVYKFLAIVGHPPARVAETFPFTNAERDPNTTQAAHFFKFLSSS
jgi:hypothetical protein